MPLLCTARVQLRAKACNLWQCCKIWFELVAAVACFVRVCVSACVCVCLFVCCSSLLPFLSHGGDVTIRPLMVHFFTRVTCIHYQIRWDYVPTEMCFILFVDSSRYRRCCFGLVGPFGTQSDRMISPYTQLSHERLMCSVCQKIHGKYFSNFLCKILSNSAFVLICIALVVACTCIAHTLGLWFLLMNVSHLVLFCRCAQSYTARLQRSCNRCCVTRRSNRIKCRPI